MLNFAHIYSQILHKYLSAQCAILFNLSRWYWDVKTNFQWDKTQRSCCREIFQANIFSRNISQVSFQSAKFLCEIPPRNDLFALWTRLARRFWCCSLCIDIKTEKKSKRALGSQSIFIVKGDHSNLDRRVRIHDPFTLSICLHSDSLLHCNNFLKIKTVLNYRRCIFRFMGRKSSCCHCYLGHFAVSVYITNAGV